VIVLGIVSFLTDVSSEAIFGVLPIFLTQIVGASTSTLGLMEGLADFASSSLDLASGYVSDRTGHRKGIAVTGYTLSSIAKTLLLFASSAWHVVAFRVVERFGKSIRGAPRDALLASISPDDKRGTTFGIHKAFDKLGAIVGPLIAYALLDRFGPTRAAFADLFAFAVVPAFMAVLVLAIFVKNRAPEGRRTEGLRTALRSLGPEIRRYLVAAAVFSLGYFSFAFLLLDAARVGFETKDIALLYAMFNAVFAVVSIPLGRLGDHIGRRALVAISYALYAMMCLGLAFASTPAEVGAMFVVYAIFFAIDEAQTRAFLADITEAPVRATAMGLYGFITGLVYLPASLIAGILWKAQGPEVTFAFGAAIAVLALVFFLVRLRPAATVIAVLALSLAGCGKATRFIATPDSKAGSMLVALETDGSPPELYAADARGGVLVPLPRSGAGTITLLLYPFPLAALDVESGPVIPSGSDHARAIPETKDLFSALVSDGKVGAWSMISSPSAAVSAIHLQPLDLGRCADRGGCYTAELGADLCTVPCPTPTVPSPPVLTPCPPGWTQSGSEPVTCEPPPQIADVACAADQAQYYGDDHCTTIGSPCPSGDYSDQLPTGPPILYVRSGTTTGLGTMSSPFGSIAAAMQHARAGTTVAVAKGTYDESISIPGGVTLLGACVKSTLIRGVSTSPALSSTTAGVTVQDVQLQAQVVALSASARSSGLSIQGVLIEGPIQRGIDVRGRGATGDDVVVRGSLQEGLRISGQMSLSRAVIEDNANIAIRVAGDRSARLVLDRAAIRRTVSSTTVDFAALSMESGTASVSHVMLSHVQGTGIWVRNLGTRVDVSDVSAYDITTYDSGVAIIGGLGAQFTDGAMGSISRMVGQRCQRSVAVVTSKGRASFRDIVARDTSAPGIDTRSYPIYLLDGASASIERVLIERTPNDGLELDGAISATISDAVVRASAGCGFYTIESTRVIGSRILLDSNTDGFLIGSNSLSVGISDAVTRATNGLAAGTKLKPAEMTAFSLNRFELDGGTTCVDAQIPGTIELHDGLVTHCGVGIIVAPANLDPVRILDHVTYRDNTVNLRGM
jgi:MFS family permease